MKVLSSLFLSFLFFLPINLFGQKEPMKFGKIPEDDLAMTVFEPDPEASAVVLGDFGKLNFLFKDSDVLYHFYRHRRIKLLKRSSFEMGDILIPYYSKDRMEQIKDLKARVVSPGGVEMTVDRKDIFDEEVNEYWSQKRFSFPNLEEGAVIEYEYETVSRAILQLPEWYFQGDIPIRWSELRLEVPEWYDYVFITQGRPLDIAEVEKSSEKFYASGNVGGGVNLNLTTNKIRYVMKDVPALKEEPFITTMHDYYARIQFQLSSIQYTDRPIQRVMSDWPMVAKDLLDDTRFGDQIQKKKFHDEIWEAIRPEVEKTSSPEEKLSLIYHFVVNTFDREEGWGIYVRKDLNECFQRKTAFGHEMNLAMLALLMEAGIEAYPVLVSTRSHGKMLPLYPLVDQFNYVMALAVLDDNQILLDATHPFRPMGYPSVNALNSQGWAVMKDNPQWINIVPQSGSDTYLMNFKLNDEGMLDGSIVMSSNGYSAIAEREQYQGSPSGESFKKRITRIFPDAQVNSIEFEDMADLSKPVKVTVQCSLPDMAQLSGDFLYLAPALMSSFNENPFSLEKRSYQVDIPYSFQERLVLNLELPKGYTVEELPESIRMALLDKAGRFHFQLSMNGQKLQMVSSLQIDRLRFEPEEYEALRNFFGMVEEKMGEQIVLKKIE